jgi:hypothetical protein
VIISREERFCDEFVVDDRFEVAFSRCAAAALLSLFLGGRPVLLSGLYTHWTPLWLYRQHEGLPRLHRTLDSWQLSHAVRSLGPFVVVVVVFDCAKLLMAVLTADAGSASGSQGKSSMGGCQ